MSPLLRASALAVATLTASAHIAQAADLGHRDYGNRSGSAYDDPRYADLYGDAPPAPPQPERRYAAPYQPHPQPHPGYGQAPIPREPVYRDHEPRYHYKPYADAAPRHRSYASGSHCLPRDEIRYGLERDGWQDFRDPQVIDQGTALLTARRNGRPFQLKVDRCTGHVLTARPLEQYRPYADYGYRPHRAY
jgi:hypothetical protein